MDEKFLEQRLREDARRLCGEFSPSLHERLKQVIAEPPRRTFSWRQGMAAGALACGLLLGVVWWEGDFRANSGTETASGEDFGNVEQGFWATLFPWTETVVLLADVSEIPLQEWRSSSSILTEESQYWMERLAPLSVWTVATWSLEEDWEQKEHEE